MLPLLFLITLIYTYTYLSKYISLDVIPGWDGAQHYAINKAYSDIIFPKLQGIIPNWYAGLPWPTFYPPLFTYTMAILAHVLPLSYFTIFHWLFLILTFIFPLLVYWIAGKLDCSPIESLLAGYFSILFLVSSGDQAGTLGIAMGGTFENGLYPQFFAACAFLVWLGVFLSFLRSLATVSLSQHSKQTKKVSTIFRQPILLACASALLFGFVLLSNVHIAQPALLTFLVYALLYSIKYRAKIYLWFGFQLSIALLLASVWYVPLLRYNSYFLTQTITEVPVSVALLSLFVPLTLGVIGGWVGIKQKQLPIVGLLISALIILFIIVMPWARVWQGLPLQPFRVFPVSYLYLMLLAPLGLLQIMDWLKLKGLWKVVGIVILLAPMLYWYPPVDHSISGLYSLSQADNDLIAFMKEKTDGRSIFEVWLDDNPTPYLPKAKQPTHFMLSALVASSSKHQTLWSAFRESSIISPFVQPLRNAFSYRHESYGVTCYLCVETNGRPGFQADEFYDQPWEEHLKRARLMGVKYIAIQTDLRKSLYQNLPPTEITSAHVFGDWQVFEVTDANLDPIPLMHEPILTLARLNPRTRYAEGEDAYDWLRLNEEWFFHGKFDQVLARSKASDIEDIQELADFNYLFLPELTYFDKEKALSMIVNYAKDHHVILLQSDDPLFQQLLNHPAMHKDHLHIVDKTGNVRTDMGAVLDILTTINPQSETAGRWLLHKYTYFPTLASQYQNAIHLASPAFILEQRVVR